MVPPAPVMDLVLELHGLAARFHEALGLPVLPAGAPDREVGAAHRELQAQREALSDLQTLVTRQLVQGALPRVALEPLSVLFKGMVDERA